jgi:hypothetical protein
MPTELTETAFYAALCSDVYHHGNADQWIDLAEIKAGLEPVNAVTDLDLVDKLFLAGFTPATDGFYYTPNGFGARLVLDGDKYIIAVEIRGQCIID